MKELKIYNPFSLEEISRLPLQEWSEVAEKLEKAYQLFRHRENWLPVHQRMQILENVVKLMQNQVNELALLAASEGGKPLQDSLIEVNRAINGVKLAIENIGQMKGEQIPMGMTAASANRLAFTLREPIGVVVSVSAFNHPLNLIIHQTVPALAVGSPVLIKPASTTPLSCLRFAEILAEAGLPQGWFQTVICDRDTAEKLVTDRRVNYFSFIGSAEVGWSLRSKLAAGTRCALEHGGVAPVILAADADLDDAVPALLKGGFYHAGQVCVSVQKIFIDNKIIAEVAERLKAAVLKLHVGNQLVKETEVGPLILPQEVDRIEKWVNEAAASGSQILCGGKRLSSSCYAPTILLNPDEKARVSQEEVFAPVICLYGYDLLDDAIAKANSLRFAFQAAVFTQNLDTALKTVNRLNASAVMVNDHTAFRVDWMPFGGRDASGLGTGGIPYSMREMTREKLIVIKNKNI